MAANTSRKLRLPDMWVSVPIAMFCSIVMTVGAGAWYLRGQVDAATNDRYTRGMAVQQAHHHHDDMEKWADEAEKRNPGLNLPPIPSPLVPPKPDNLP